MRLFVKILNLYKKTVGIFSDQRLIINLQFKMTISWEKKNRDIRSWLQANLYKIVENLIRSSTSYH